MMKVWLLLLLSLLAPPALAADVDPHKPIRGVIQVMIELRGIMTAYRGVSAAEPTVGAPHTSNDPGHFRAFRVEIRFK